MTDDPARAEYRASLGLPDSVASCHTGMVDGYAIEGHVPAAAIVRLLADRPDVIGLAVPGMPADSPGMGGDEASWAAQRVLVVSRDGSVASFPF